MSKLLSFKVENYRSFHESRTFTFCGESSEAEGWSAGAEAVSSVSAVYGANSSGKSNLLDAMASMRKHIQESIRVNDGEALMYDPFVLAANEEQRPQCFECTFADDEGSRIRYGFKNTAKEIASEWLFMTAAGSSEEKALFLRESEGIGLNDELFAEGEKFIENLNPNRLFLSLVAQLGGKVSKKVLKYFAVDFNILSGLNASGYMSFTQREFLEGTSASQAAMQFFKAINLGFEGIEVREEPLNPEILKGFSTEVRERMPKSELQTYSRHEILNEGGEAVKSDYFLFSRFESDGTDKVFTLSGPIFDTLERGSLLAIDELDAKLHPLLSQAIVRLFADKSTNPRGAQLLFTTHDSNLLNTGLLKPEEIWFTEKDSLQATDLYRLSDIRMPDGGAMPNKQDYERNYIQGRYGGIPFVRFS